MSEQTPTTNNDPRHAAIGNLAFLLSVIRGGDTLSADEEAVIHKTMDRLAEAAGASVPQEVAAIAADLRCEVTTSRCSDYGCAVPGATLMSPGWRCGTCRAYEYLSGLTGEASSAPRGQR